MLLQHSSAVHTMSSLRIDVASIPIVNFTPPEKGLHVRMYDSGRSDDFDIVFAIWKEVCWLLLERKCIRGCIYYTNTIVVQTNTWTPARGDNRQTVERCLEIGGGLFIMFDATEQAIGTAWVTCDGRRMSIHYFGISFKL
jgi:hypothetical protein